MQQFFTDQTLIIILIGAILLLTVSIFYFAKQTISVKEKNAFFHLLLFGLLIFFILHIYSIKIDQSRDLLMVLEIVLAFTGLMGYGTYRFIKEEITKNAREEIIKDAKKEITKHVFIERSKTRSENFLLTAFLLWHIYSNQTKKDKILLKTIIEKSESALRDIEYLEKNNKWDIEESILEEFICVCKNDLTYYLAERGKTEDEEIIKSYLKDIIKKKKKYPHLAYEWTNTCSFAKTKFPNMKISC